MSYNIHKAFKVLSITTIKMRPKYFHKIYISGNGTFHIDQDDNIDSKDCKDEVLEESSEEEEDMEITDSGSDFVFKRSIFQNIWKIHS